MYSLIFWTGKSLKWLKGRFVILPQRSTLRQTIFNLYVTDLQITSIHPQLVTKMQCLVKGKKPLQKPCTIHLAQRRIQKDRDQSKCRLCNLQYIGETKLRLKDRFNEEGERGCRGEGVSVHRLKRVGSISCLGCASTITTNGLPC